MLEMFLGAVIGGTTALFSLGLCKAAKQADESPSPHK
jgi:hypothetical protein